MLGVQSMADAIVRGSSRKANAESSPLPVERRIT
jgi:hypothetical protein